MDEGPDLDAHRCAHFERLVGLEHGERFVGELGRAPLDLLHLVVADHGPKRPESVFLDPVDRAPGVKVKGFAPPGCQGRRSGWGS